MLRSEPLPTEDIPNFQLGIETIRSIAPVGFLLAFDISTTGQKFAVCEYPEPWQEQYVAGNYKRSDPLVTWALGRDGSARWSVITYPDVNGVLKKSKAYDMEFGGVVSIEVDGKRSILTAARKDRELKPAEITKLAKILKDFSYALFANRDISDKELDVLRLLAKGFAIDSVAEELSLSTRAVKKRIANARRALRAKTTIEAVANAIRQDKI